MKIIRYTFNGNQTEIEWNKVNEGIAKREADNSKYTIEDDGQPDVEEQGTNDERITDLEEAVALILSGVTE